MTNPSPEQIEAAAKAIQELEESGELDPPTVSSRLEMKRYYQALARAALVAAAGVTPQEPGGGGMCGCDGPPHRYDPCWCRPGRAARVAVLAQVDEAKLADVIWGEQEARALDGFVIHTRATAATTARVVAVWLRGGGQ